MINLKKENFEKQNREEILKQFKWDFKAGLVNKNCFAIAEKIIELNDLETLVFHELGKMLPEHADYEDMASVVHEFISVLRYNPEHLPNSLSEDPERTLEVLNRLREFLEMVTPHKEITTYQYPYVDKYLSVFQKIQENED